MKVGIVLGTRPEIIKNAPIVRALRERGMPFEVLHTNQHSDPAMHADIFTEMEYAPTRVMDGTYAIGRAIDWVRGVVRDVGVDLVLVNGDTAAALVGAVAAVYSDVGLAHVEAGLRSFDPEMCEERNRIMVDAAAHYLFAYTAADAEFLRGRPELRGRIHDVGNTTVDVIHDFADRLPQVDVRGHAFVTLHRKELTDRLGDLVGILGTLRDLRSLVSRVVLPLHPRTRDILERSGVGLEALEGLDVRPPMSPLRALAYQKHAALVVTDSGCMQEEAYLFGVPCVTVRPNTERHATLATGANVVCGYRPHDVLAACRHQLSRTDATYPPLYGPPGAGRRIVAILAESFRDFRRY